MTIWLQAKVCMCGLGLRPRLNTGPVPHVLHAHICASASLQSAVHGITLSRPQLGNFELVVFVSKVK